MIFAWIKKSEKYNGTFFLYKSQNIEPPLIELLT